MLKNFDYKAMLLPYEPCSFFSDQFPDGRSVHPPEPGEIIEFPAVHGLHHYDLQKAA